MIYMILILTAIAVLIGLGIMLYIIFKPNHTVTDVVDKNKDVCDIEEDKKVLKTIEISTNSISRPIDKVLSYFPI